MGHFRGTLRLQGYSAVGHCKETLKGYPSVRHCTNVLRLSTTLIDVLRLGTARMLRGWVAQGCTAVGSFAVGHDTRGGEY